jgi:hypothetical protein
VLLWAASSLVCICRLLSAALSPVCLNDMVAIIAVLILMFMMITVCVCVSVCVYV